MVLMLGGATKRPKRAKGLIVPTASNVFINCARERGTATAAW
jgi:hypothetical protein